MTAMPSPTRYLLSLKSRLVIAAFVGVVCLGYVCMISIDRSVSLKSQSNVAWLRSQTHTTLNTTKTATRETFHHAPKVVYTTKMGLLSRVSDTSAGDIIYVEKKQALLVTSQEKQVAVLEGFSDIIHMKPPTFLANYKNPCWFETVPTMANGQFRHPVNVSKFSCLPYYMIVGQPKSGTTDLYYALQIHPDVTKCNIKEPHWWTRKRKNAEMSMLSRYVAYFSDAAQQIQKIIRITSTGERFHPRITGEASASTFWDMSYWRKMPENRGLDEPQYLTAHYIKHILPEVKIMVILRNPLDRLLSDSFYFSRAKTLEMFHGHVVESVAILRGCFQQRDVQRCLNDTTITNQLKARVHLGLYHVFLVAWLNVFPRNQVKVLQLEEYSRNRTAAMTDIFNFLDLDPLPAAEALMLQEAAVRNKRPDKRRSRSMLTKTRMLLEQFYRPFNERLASLLGDDKFLWNTSLPSVTASTAGLT